MDQTTIERFYATKYFCGNFKDSDVESSIYLFSSSCRTVLKQWTYCTIGWIWNKFLLCCTVMYNRISWPLLILETATVKECQTSGYCLGCLLWDGKSTGANNYYAFGYNMRFTFHWHPHFVSSSLRLGLYFSTGNCIFSTILFTSRTCLLSPQRILLAAISWRSTCIETYLASLWHHEPDDILPPNVIG